jgi:multimeric flavodoxin WrbA
MVEIIEEMKKADVIVLSSPVYFYSLSAQMKLVIDRTYAAFRELKGKQFYYIVTAADPQHEAAEPTLAAFRGFVCCLPEAKEMGVLYGTGAWDKGNIYKHPALQQAYEMGKAV